MEELLKKLLEQKILTTDTQKQLLEAFTAAEKDAAATATANTEIKVRAQLTEQWIEEKELLVEAIDVQIKEVLKEEVDELKEDITSFRDLEAEYQNKEADSQIKLAEAKIQYREDLTEQYQTDLATLVSKTDQFLELRIASEVEELKEDIEQARKDNFGRRLFEAYSNEFEKSYFDDDKLETSINQLQTQLNTAQRKTQQLQESLDNSTRKTELATVLKPLQGQQREVMAAILANVDTVELKESYTRYIPRVLSQTQDTTDSEKEDVKVLAESTTNTASGFEIISGNEKNQPEQLNESSDPVITEFRRLAGLD